MSSSFGATITHQDSFGGDSDSLEYFIKFPGSTSGQSDTMLQQNGSVVQGPQGGGHSSATGCGPVVGSGNGNAESDYVFVVNGETSNIPIVLLLGWAGCQDKYLMKYSKIYEDRGLITVRYTAPIESLFWKRNDMKLLGEKVLKLLFDMNFENNPIFVHLFSNGGAYMYMNILLAIKNSSRQRHKRDLNICGSIFDSAPGQRRFMSLYRALAAIYGRRTCVVPLFISVCLVCIWIVEDGYSIMKNLITGQRPLLDRGPLQGLIDEPTAVWPHMFLYSKEDDIIPVEDIELFAKYRQEKLNVPVRKICFENSEHVKHFISHPAYYVQCVCRFINDCLNSVRNGAVGTVVRETMVTTTKID